jgi:uncharacterized membrane protein
MRQPPDFYIPQTTNDRRPLIVWLALLIFVTTLFASIIAAPIALASNHTSVALTIYDGFSHLCHQIPERSFFIAGHQFAVCARCTGIYAGFAAAVIAYPIFRPLARRDTPDRRWLFLAALPLAIDFALGFFGIWENTHWSRFATGGLLGAVAALYVVPGLVDLSYSKLMSRRMEISRG